MHSDPSYNQASYTGFWSFCMQIETMVEGTTLGVSVGLLSTRGLKVRFVIKKSDVTKRVNPAVMSLPFAERRTARSRFIALYR